MYPPAIMTGGVRLLGHPAGFLKELDQSDYSLQLGIINNPVIKILLKTWCEIISALYMTPHFQPLHEHRHSALAVAMILFQKIQMILSFNKAISCLRMSFLKVLGIRPAEKTNFLRVISLFIFVALSVFIVFGDQVPKMGTCRVSPQVVKMST